MEKSTSRDRDQGRKYKAGSVKRQEKADVNQRVKKLPKITQWLTYPTVSESAKSQTQTESGQTESESVETPITPETTGEATTSTEPSVVSAIEPEHSDSEETQEEVKVMNTGTEQGFETDLGLWPKIITENVSLWGGDAVFNNLDLRLDVLEQELRLPFSFVNGHIHELRIHVPWTKLTSEPIVITINTIECILKLKDYEGSDSESTSQNEGSDNKAHEFRRRQRRQDIEVPTSYIQGLINKVINNVAIVCNNVILKYVEDDIVLSINAKTLELRSVSQNWTPSFIDLTSEDLMLRNLATLTDLTVCLDKRNASGKIENYQEPLLYRCSLSCRLIRQFESVYSHQPLSTRYDIFCPQLHFSLSDTQLPMFLRLLELLLALYYKQLQYQPPKPKLEETVTNEEGEEIPKPEGNDEDSWSSWAWSLGTSLIPIGWEENEDSPNYQNRFRFHSSLHMGIYVEIATWVFKLTESVQENTYFGPTKMHFTPFLRVEQQGSFLTVVVKGLEAVNVQLGISSLSVDPIGNCICGIADSEENALREECKDGSSSSRLGFARCGRESQEYLSLSLFDERILLGAREIWDYQYIWDNHISSVTEGSLLERTKAFGMDYLYLMEIPSDITSEKLSEINVNPEYSDLSERALCRFVFGPLEINVSSGFFHRMSAIEFGLEQYDYTPYSSQGLEEELQTVERPSEDEIYFLESNFACRTYTVTCIEPCIILHAAQHPIVDMRNVFNARRRKKNQKASADFCMARIMAVSSVALKVTKIEAEFVRAMYPKRQVKTASMLRPPSATMLHNCHSHLSFKFHNCALSLLNEEGWAIHIIQGLSSAVYLKTLLLPQFWTSCNQPRMELFVETEQLTLSSSMPQILLLHYLINSWFSEIPSPEELRTHSLVDDAIRHADRFSILTLNLHCFESKFCETPSLYAGFVTVGSVSLALCKANQDIICYLLNGPETVSNLEVLTETFSVSEKLLRASFQFPKESGNESIPSVLSIRLLKMSSILGPQMTSCLKYAPKPCRKKELKNEFFLKRISEVKSVPKLSRKSSDCEIETLRQESSSTTLSEAKTTSKIMFFGRQSSLEEVPRVKSWKERFVEVYPLISNLIIHVEVETVTLFLPSHSINISSQSGLVNAVHRIYLTRGEKTSLGDTTVLCLPHILLQNSAQKQSLVDQIYDVPIILPKTAWSEGKDKLPWSLKLTNFHVYSLQSFGESIKLPILKPVNTTATLAVNPKYKGPILNQVGTVIHLDMSPLDFSGSKRQVEAHVTIVEGFLSLISFYVSAQDKSARPDTLSYKQHTVQPKTKQPSEKVNPLPSDQTQTKTGKENLSQNVHNPLIYSQPQETAKLIEQTSTKSQHNFGDQTKRSVSDPTVTVPLTDADEPEDTGKAQPSNESEIANPNSIVVTSWVQWTVARVSASLFAHSGSETKKLRGEIEDLTMWVDLHQVYSKIKCKIANLSVLHFTKRGSEWVEGEHEGVIMTAGDQLTREVKVVNPSNRPPSEHSAKALNAAAPSLDQPKTHGFLSLTITMAQCKNIHSKWNQMVKKHLREERCIKECNSPQYLSEVDIRIQPFDCIFFPPTLQSFASVYEPWLLLQVPKQLLKTAGSSKRPMPFGLSVNNKVLPLMYVQTEPIRMFFPSKETSSQDSNVHNVVLIQLNSMLISPQVDNPLSRIILRQDIFSAAEQSRILGVPGSEVEDRQYQIDFLGFSISTGSWFDLINIKKGRPRSLSSERLGVRGENPALEWNNYDPAKDNSDEEVVMYPLVARLDTRIIAAPAIVYSTVNEDGSSGDALLVAGHSLEINATTDFDIYASLVQILLSKDVVNGISAMITHMQTYGTKIPSTSLSSEVLDSGVDCDISSIDLSKTGLKAADKDISGRFGSLDFVPIEVLITGSKITLNIFEKCLIEGQKVSMKGWQRNKLEQRARTREKQMALEVASTESEPSPLRAKSGNFTSANLKYSAAKSTSHIAEMEDGYEGSEEESVYDPQPVSTEPQLRFLPLLFVAVSQPHTFFTCRPQHQKIDVSCFDIAVKSVPKGFSIKATELKKLPKPEDYTTSWLETRPGDSHPKTGIPPAFLTLSAFDFFHKAAQVSIEVGRPFRLCLSQTKWEQIQHVVSSLEKVLPQKLEESLEELQANIPSGSRVFKMDSCNSSGSLIEGLREKLSQIDNINFITNQISLNIEVTKNSRIKSELYTSLSGLNLTLSTVRKKQNQSPDGNKEAITEICCKGDVQGLQVKTLFQNLELQTLLKPWAIHGEVKLMWLQWKIDPDVNIKLQSEIIQVNFGPENFFCLMEIWKYLEKFMDQFKSKSDKSFVGVISKPLIEEVYSDLFFQDDLRAGVFQYVSYPTSSTKEIFPQPYQVLFDKALGLMVWCYPEPRALIRVDIYPVPFIAASEISTMTYDTEESDLVLCALQYFDALRDSFVTYQRFHLSESKFCQLDLPSVHEKKLLAVSTIWRVCIDYKDDDYDEQKKGGSLLSPEALAACMRVDSLFSVSVLPTTQAVFMINKCDFTLVNHLDLTGSKLPSKLRGYSMDDTVPNKQSFITFTLDDVCVRTYSWTTGNHIEANGKFSIHVLNYKFLTNNVLLEHSTLHVSISIQEAEGKEKPKCYDCSMMAKAMYIHVNQSTVHTLSVAHECWKQTFFVVEDPTIGLCTAVKSSLPAILMTNYILTNNTTESLRFGQVNTDENLLLESGAVHLYSWRSHKIPPTLRVCIESNKWKWCEAIHLENEGTRVCTLSHFCEVGIKFLVTCKKFSPKQMCVTFGGLLSVANCLSEDLEFRVIDKTIREDSPKNANVVPLKSQTLSPSLVGDPHSLRVRVSCGVIWSGEIPLTSETSKDSVTVRIPLKSKKECILALCKVYRERVGSVWRLLVVFSSHFIVRSHLPRSLTIYVTTPSSNSTQQATIKGRGNSYILNCDTSQPHHLTFQLSPELDVSKPPIPITRAIIEQVRQSSSDETTDLSTFMENLFKGPKEKWPYIDSSFIEGDFLFADQPKIDLQIGFSSLYSHCNTLVIDVRPWALIINHAGTEILLQEGDSLENTWYIPSGVVFAPPKLENFFTFGVVFGKGEHVFSIPLQLSKEERWYTLKFEGRVPRVGTTNISIIFRDKACFFTILSSYEENIQILYLVPTYSISNNTDQVLSVRPLHVVVSEERLQVPKLPSSICLPPTESVTSHLHEIPLLFWDIVKRDSPQMVREEVICLQIGRNEMYSHPVVLQNVSGDRRTTFTIPSDVVSDVLNESFILTIHPVNNRVKFVVQKDPTPQMVLHNNTSVLLIIGQGSLEEEGITEEEMDVFAALPSVPPLKAVFYTFPNVSTTFPEVTSIGIKHPKLHFSQPDVLNNAEVEEVVWSQGLDIHQHYDQFVCIPSYGDVKIHIERVGHTLHIYIDPASRVEISAKDIRSRIATPSSQRKVASPNDKGKGKDENTPGSEVKTETEEDTKESLTKSEVIFGRKKVNEEIRVFYATFSCSEFSFVMKDDINNHKSISEVLRISLDNFIMIVRPQLNLSEKLRTLNFCVRNRMEVTVFVGDAQIDNQMFSEGNYDFPVVLMRQNAKHLPHISPLDPIERAIQMSYNDALCSVSVVLENASSLLCIQSMNIRIKPLTLYIEDTLIYSLAGFINSFVGASFIEPFNLRKEEEEEEKSFLKMKLPCDILVKSNAMTRPIHINHLHIEAISVLLSIHASIKLYIALDHSPLRFKEYQRTEVLTTSYSFGHNLTMHYLSSALFRAGWVVSSLDLLGNPGGFARTVGSGIRDFVQLPYEGILQGPWAFIAGITHGSLSLVKHITAGTLVSVTNLASSVARNMERLSLDEDHLTRNEANRRSKPSGLTKGVIQGLSSFGISLLGAIGGLAHQPIQAVLSDGISPSSLMGGFGKGLVGVVAKPIGGAADFFVHTGQGLLHGTGWKQDLEPRIFSVKEPYSDVANAPLKVIWKLLVALPMECRHVICAADATLVTSAGLFSPVTVLLTPQVLFIVGVDEDAQQHALTLHELEWKCHSADPTLLYLEKSSPPVTIANDDAEPISGCPERVADYVRSTCSEGVDGDQMDNDSTEEDLGGRRKSSRVKLYLSSQWRSFLVSCINIAVRATKGKGFIS